MKISNHLLIAEQHDPSITFIKTPNVSTGFSPLFLLVHYTAGTTAEGAASWFQNKASQASAHIIIDRNGSIIQMVPFNRRAWHAGKSKWGNLEGLNQYAIGIELVNAGKLRQDSAGRWLTWSNQVIPEDDVTIAKHKDETTEHGWHEYTAIQLEVASKLGSLLHQHYQFTDVLGHDDVSPGRKTDPGPLFPMISFRSMVMGGI